MNESSLKPKRGWQIAGIVVTLLALYYFVRFVLTHATSLPDLELSPKVLVGLSFSILGYVVVLFLGGLVWLLLMKGVGSEANCLDTYSVFFVS